MQNPGKWIIAAGLLMTLVGVIVYVWYARFPKATPGHLPFDFKYESKNLKVYFPLGTSILLSVVLSAVLYFLSKLGSK